MLLKNIERDKIKYFYKHSQTFFYHNSYKFIISMLQIIAGAVLCNSIKTSINMQKGLQLTCKSL